MRNELSENDEDGLKPRAGTIKEARSVPIDRRTSCAKGIAHISEHKQHRTAIAILSHPQPSSLITSFMKIVSLAGKRVTQISCRT